MNKFYKKIFITLFIAVTLFIAPIVIGNQTVFAEGDGTVKKTGDATVVDPASVKPGLQITLTNPLKSDKLEDFVQIVLSVILKFLIPILAILFILTGFQLVMARGEPKAIATAKTNFFNLVIGTVLILGAWTFGNIIMNTLREVGILNK